MKEYDSMKKVSIVILLIVSVLGALWIFKTKFQPNSPLSQATNTQTATEKPPTKITLITYATKLNHLPMIIALKKGFFQKYNLDVETQNVSKNSLSVMVAGKADAIIFPLHLTLASAIEGAPISWVATLNNKNSMVLVSIKDPKQIQSAGIFSGLDKITSLELLRLAGANVDNVKFQEMTDIQTKLTAFKNKQIDSIVVTKTDWLTFQEKADLSSNEYKTFFDASSDDRFSVPLAIILRNEFLKNNKEQAQNFTKALIEADAWMKDANNKEETIKLFSEYYSQMPLEEAKVYVEVYLSTLGGLNIIPNAEKGVEILKLISNINPKAKDYNIQNFISTETFNTLKSSGFIDQFSF